MKKYNKSNCKNLIGLTLEDVFGNKLTLCGKFTHEYSIVKETDGKLIITTFKSRVEAIRELKRLTRK